MSPGRADDPHQARAAALSIASNALLIALKLAAGGDHRLDRDPHRGGPLADRPGRLGDRLRLGPQGRRAGRRRASLRPREGREPGRDDRGDADPGRRRDHRLRGDPPAGRRRRGREPRGRHRRDGLLGARQPRRLGRPLAHRPGRTDSPALEGDAAHLRDRRADLGRRARRPGLVQITGDAAFDSITALGRRGRRSSSPGSGSSAAPPACWSTKRCRDAEMDRIEAAIAAARTARGGRLPQAARPPRRAPPLHRPPRPVPLGHHASSAPTSSPTEMRDAIEAEIPATPRC